MKSIFEFDPVRINDEFKIILKKYDVVPLFYFHDAVIAIDKKYGAVRIHLEKIEGGYNIVKERQFYDKENEKIICRIIKSEGGPELDNLFERQIYLQNLYYEFVRDVLDPVLHKNDFDKFDIKYNVLKNIAFFEPFIKRYLDDRYETINQIIHDIDLHPDHENDSQIQNFRNDLIKQKVKCELLRYSELESLEDKLDNGGESNSGLCQRMVQLNEEIQNKYNFLTIGYFLNGLIIYHKDSEKTKVLCLKKFDQKDYAEIEVEDILARNGDVDLISDGSFPEALSHFKNNKGNCSWLTKFYIRQKYLEDKCYNNLANLINKLSTADEKERYLKVLNEIPILRAYLPRFKKVEESKIF